MSQENPPTALPSLATKSKEAHWKQRYVPISAITPIHNRIYHLALYRRYAHLICRFSFRLTQNKAMSAFIITKLSRFCDRTQEQLLAMHLRKTQVQGAVEIEHVALIDTHKHTQLHKNTVAWALRLSSPADRQMARVTLSHWHGGAYNLKPCLHLKIHQYHIDVQYTSCQRGPSRLQRALAAVPYA